MKAPSKPSSRHHSLPGSSSLTMHRQKLFWVLTASMFFCMFLGWSNRLSLETIDNEAVTATKAFQVNALHENYTGVVKQISLIGERNSGTKWMWGHLVDCFNHSENLQVRKRFSRYKHWFQPHDYWRYPHDTLVIAEFRNPYDWLLAMIATPHHCPAHAGLPWKEFITKPWTMERIGLDLELKGDEMCQHHFKYHEVISCVHKPEPHKPVDNRYSLDKPFYEMRNDGSGEPYDNIMEMRSDKIRNIMEIKDFPGVADLWTISYEHMLATGTKELLDRITEWTGVEAKCDPYPPQFRRQRNMTAEFVQFVTDHLNWTVEEMIGYEPTILFHEPASEVNNDDDVGDDDK